MLGAGGVGTSGSELAELGELGELAPEQQGAAPELRQASRSSPLEGAACWRRLLAASVRVSGLLAASARFCARLARSWLRARTDECVQRRSERVPAPIKRQPAKIRYKCSLPPPRHGAGSPSSSGSTARPPGAAPSQAAHSEEVPARQAAQSMQGLWRLQRLPPRQAALQMRGVWRRQRLPPRQAALQMRGVRRWQYLPPRQAARHLRSVRRLQHLPPRQAALPMRRMPKPPMHN